MCNASKEMEGVVKQLLEQIRSEHRASRGVSLRELLVPAVMIAPVVIGASAFAWKLSEQITTYTNKVDVRLERLEQSTRSRYTREDAFRLCANRQKNNPKVKFGCTDILTMIPSIPDRKLR